MYSSNTKVKLMRVSLSLKKVERDIIKEFEKENIQVCFRMKNLSPQGFSEYDLASKDSAKEVPQEAHRIIEKHIQGVNNTNRETRATSKNKHYDICEPSKTVGFTKLSSSEKTHSFQTWKSKT
jgi:hypothetical protein